MVQVVPVHAAELMPHGGDIDYPGPKPRRGRLLQQGEQTLCEQEVPEVVGLPGHLEPVLCHIPGVDGICFASVLPQSTH